MQQSYGKISREFLFYLQKLIGALDLKFCITQNNSCQLFYALSINFVFLLAHFRSGPIVATKKTLEKVDSPISKHDRDDRYRSCYKAVFFGCIAKIRQFALRPPGRLSEGFLSPEDWRRRGRLNFRANTQEGAREYYYQSGVRHRTMNGNTGSELL
jgi:hypothetical protein